MRKVALVLPWLLVALVWVVPATLAAPTGDQPQGGWVGVMLGRLDPQPAGDEDRPAREGVPVRFVVEDSPAAEAGLRARDRILSVNGVRVTSTTELLATLRLERPGNWIPLTVDRRGAEREFHVRLGSRPQNLRQLRTRRAWIGVELIDLTPALRTHFGAPEDSGAMIAEIEPGSPAEAAGFEVGDVVFEFDGDRVSSAGDFVDLVASGGVGNATEFGVARSGAVMVLEAVLEVAPATAER